MGGGDGDGGGGEGGDDAGWQRGVEDLPTALHCNPSQHSLLAHPESGTSEHGGLGGGLGGGSAGGGDDGTTTSFM
tara:strand:- start:274 stop:498 length:225 start_codon:yes stop_codon:yes gene_type:complete